MQIPATTTRREGGLPYKWLVASVVIFGIFMSVLDTTIVNIAVPRFQTAFGADLNSVQWVVTGYILAQGVATPLTAFLSNRIGMKRSYLIALVLFTIGSALCGFAWSLPILIFFRVLQGAGGAFLLPLSITLLYREFPPNERGTAMGALGIPILLAPALGPTLGGYIVTYAGWPLIFFINVPIGILGFILGYILLNEGEINPQASFDIPGFLLSASGLASLLYGLSSVSSDGWTSGTVLGTLAYGFLALTAFVILELSITRRGGQPLLDLTVFGNWKFTANNIASILVTFALYGGLFVVPIYLQNVRHLSAYQAGLVLLPQALASMVAVVVGGRLVDKLGVRAIVVPGLLLLVFTNWRFTFLDTHIPYLDFQFLLVLRGIGIGLALQPLMLASLSEIPPHQLSGASSLNTALRFIGSSLTIAIIATMLQTQTKVHYSHLAELVTPGSRTGQLIQGLQALLISKGAAINTAYTSALSVISGQLRLQSYVLAMIDVFWLSLVLAAIGAASAFIANGPTRKRLARDQPDIQLSDDQREEMEKAREEALIGG